MQPYRRLERVTRTRDGYPSLDKLLYAKQLTVLPEAAAETPIFARLVADTRDQLDEARKTEEDQAAADEATAQEARSRMSAMAAGWERARAERGLPTEAQIQADAAEAAVNRSALDDHMLTRVRDGLLSYA